MTVDSRNPDRGSPCGGVFDQPEAVAGNYFVSTYPPFSCWTREGVDAYLHRLEQPQPSSRSVPLGLYVHFPFCVDRCHYCYYLSHDDRPGDMAAYVDALGEELAIYGTHPVLAGRELAFVYFGGGTPSLLSAARIQRLFGLLQSVLPWDAAREVCFECAPRSVTREKLSLLRELGVTRVSLGVQQLDDRVLRANGRVHLTEDVDRAWDALSAVGFDVLNIDLMVGLADETDSSFFGSLDRVLARQPESITIYQLEIPLNTPLYRAIRDGTLQTELPTWDVKRARLAAAMQRIDESGYSRRSAYSAVRDPARHSFVYQDEQYHGADLLGIGASAFSHLGGVNHQNRAGVEPYLESLSRGELPLWRAHALNDRERAVREFVLQLKLGRVDRASFREKHGVDAVTFFAAPLAEAAEKGYLHLDETAINVTTEGLVRIDRLLPAFYLPEHQGVRYT